jgi:retron-type reverse transcriptase
MSYYGDYTRLANLYSDGGTANARQQAGSRRRSIADFADIIDHENLIRVYWEIRRAKGQAPGVDGVTAGQLGIREVPRIMRALSHILRHKAYHPQALRKCPIPKSGGGMRTLQIQTLTDRIVTAAQNHGLSPLWEDVFLPGSFGFRPNRSHVRLLAHMDALAILEGLTVLRTEDLLDAFDHIRLDHLLEDHAKYIKEDNLFWLCKTVLLGSGPPRRKIGIGQGNAYSPTGLNARMHHAHDLRLKGAFVDTAWLRYADNCIYLCKSADAADRVGAFARDSLAETGLTFNTKGHCLVDLREQESAEILGFHVRIREEQMVYRVGDGPFGHLEEVLLEAHESADPPGQATEVIKGWVNAYGPAWSGYEPFEPTQDRLLAMLKSLGFDRIVYGKLLGWWMAAAHNRWVELRRAVEDHWGFYRLGHGIGTGSSFSA